MSSNLPLEELRGSLKGRLITPGQLGYDEFRAVALGGHDKRPAAIVRVAEPGDVAKVVTFAARHGAELAVRSGGHSSAGHGATEGGIVIDLRDMKSIEVDAAGRTLWAETGATAGHVTHAAAEHGLAVGFGDTGSVGIGGITLGGGVGYLVRKHGLTIDALLAAEIVTANGEIVTADAENHPDLFWAIRGGGGNFGVATRFKFRLEPLTEFTGGMMILPANAETIAGFVAAAEAAPEELSTIASIMPAPPMPFLPPEAAGQLIIMAMIGYAGRPEAAEEALKPFRALAKPYADFVKAQPYTAMYQDEGFGGPPPVIVSRTLYVNDIDREAADSIVGFLTESEATMRMAQIRVLGGAASRIPADATAYAHRDSRIMVLVVAFCETAADRPSRQAWVEDFAETLQQGEETGAYVNFVGDEGPAMVRAAYPGATWDRLAKIKAKYDPANLFRLNQNIPPAA